MTGSPVSLCFPVWTLLVWVFCSPIDLSDIFKHFRSFFSCFRKSCSRKKFPFLVQSLHDRTRTSVLISAASQTVSVRVSWQFSVWIFSPWRFVSVSWSNGGGAGRGSVSCWRTFGEDKQLSMDTHWLSARIEPVTFPIKGGLCAR